MKPQKSENEKPAEPARDPDLAGAEVAMRRAAERARRRAAENGTRLALYENGKIVWVKPDRDSLVNGGGSSRNGKQGEVVP